MKIENYCIKQRCQAAKVALCIIIGFIAVAFQFPIAVFDTATLNAAASDMSGSPGSFSQLVKKVTPSVVNISTVRVVKGHPYPFGSPYDSNDPFRDFFERFFPYQMPREQNSLGSGFIIDKDGFIITNNHMVEKMDEIMVKLNDENEYPAKVVGRDPETDLALIHIDVDKPLKPVALGNSDELEIGDWVVAIGNPFGLGNTVTAGIVSSKYRNINAGPYDNYIQTDAPINPGNSGGPLLNTKGEVIGINTAIFTQRGGNIGIGFAIPINMAKDILPQLKEGKVTRGWLGVRIQTISPELKEKFELKDEKGALVADVVAGSPADKAGIEREDVIVSFNGNEIKEIKDLQYIVGSTPVGKIVTVEVLRNGKKKSFQVTVGELKAKSGTEGLETETELGMMVEELTPQVAQYFGLTDISGLVVVRVDYGTPAEKAGLKPGDIILEVDRAKAKGLNELNRMLKAYKKGDTILFLIKRGDGTLYLTLKVPG